MHADQSEVGAFEAAEAAAAWLRARHAPPPVAVVLGSGLSSFARRLDDVAVLPYGEIPHFAGVGVVGHAGELAVGGVGGARVAAFAGRVHAYEGHPGWRVVHAVRTMARWGVKAVLLTNAAGGIHADFAPGDLMVISDHLNLAGWSPLTGPNDDRLGPRFPDMTDAYDPALREILRGAGAGLSRPLREGVYAGLSGPAYETPAEIRMLTTLGADAVGMSTVPEAIAARHAGLRVVGVSCITNLAAGISPTPLSHDEVKETATAARADFIALLSGALPGIAEAVG